MVGGTFAQNHQQTGPVVPISVANQYCNVKVRPMQVYKDFTACSKYSPGRQNLRQELPNPVSTPFSTAEQRCNADRARRKKPLGGYWISTIHRPTSGSRQLACRTPRQTIECLLGISWTRRMTAQPSNSKESRTTRVRARPHLRIDAWGAGRPDKAKIG